MRGTSLELGSTGDDRPAVVVIAELGASGPLRTGLKAAVMTGLVMLVTISKGGEGTGNLDVF